MCSLSLARLTGRKLLRISGPDCYPYLQGLVCNDLRYLYEPDRIPKREHAINSPNVLSTFMLNAQGRSICDLLIYRTQSTRYECEFTPPGKATESDELLIECDSNLASGLANTLYGYRVRRKIEITMEDSSSVWCLFPHFDLLSGEEKSLTIAKNKNLINLSLFDLNKEVLGDPITIVNDPRLTAMGMRIITTKPDSNKFELIKKSIGSVVDADIKEATNRDYTMHRYILGVGEGPKDHPESDCLPLECNADFLGSVSFNKGCYLGQELTARIYHTGVIRKRLMPLILDLNSGSKNPTDLPLVKNSDIINQDDKKKLGVLRHVVGDRALALLRYDLAFKAERIVHEGSITKITTYAPYWWKETTTRQDS